MWMFCRWKDYRFSLRSICHTLLWYTPLQCDTHLVLNWRLNWIIWIMFCSSSTHCYIGHSAEYEKWWNEFVLKYWNTKTNVAFMVWMLLKLIACCVVVVICVIIPHTSSWYKCLSCSSCRLQGWLQETQVVVVCSLKAVHILFWCRILAVFFTMLFIYGSVTVLMGWSFCSYFFS